MADFTNIDGEVDERDDMVVDWSELTDEDRLVVAELIAEAVAEPPDDDEFHAVAAVFDALFISSESDFEGFASAGVEASMMPMFGARIDSSEDDKGENREGERDQPRMSPIRTFTIVRVLSLAATVNVPEICWWYKA